MQAKQNNEEQLF